MKRILQCLVVACVLGAGLTASAREPSREPLQLDTPYSAGPDVLARVEVSDGWSELYRVKPGQEAAAMALFHRQQTPMPLGMVVDGEAHVFLHAKELVLSQTQASSTRAGTPVSYDPECRVMAQPGDLLTMTFNAPKDGWSATLSVRVRETFVYGQTNPWSSDSTRMDKVGPANCSLVQQNRVLYQGTLTMRRSGRVMFTEPVFYQTIID